MVIRTFKMFAYLILVQFFRKCYIFHQHTQEKYEFIILSNFWGKQVNEKQNFLLSGIYLNSWN